MLLAVPKYGRVKTNRILNQCRISPAKTIGGLSERQRAELVSLLGVHRPLQRPGRRVGHELSPRPADLWFAHGLRHHRPLRRRQGHSDRGPAASAFPTSSCRSRRRPDAPRQGEVDGATTTSSPRRSSTGGSRRATSSSSPPTAGTATGRCAPRSSGGSRRVARWCSRSRCRAPARCAPRCASRSRSSSPRPIPACCASALSRAAPTRPRRSTPARGRRAGARGPGRVRLRVVNDDLDRAAGDLEEIVRAELGLPLDSAANDQTTRRQAARARRLPLRSVVVAAKRARQINSYFHNLGEGSFGEFPPPMVEVGAERNYLTIALEELAEGKLKYQYRPERQPAHEAADGQNPAWRERRDRRLQVARVGPPGDRRRSRRARDPMTEAAPRFVGAASFEGIVGAPVLISEFERDPLRGAFPGDAAPDARPDRPPRAGRQLPTSS